MKKLFTVIRQGQAGRGGLDPNSNVFKPYTMKYKRIHCGRIWKVNFSNLKRERNIYARQLENAV